MTSFADLGLSEKALESVARMGFDTPTPVQERAIPLVLQGHDIIAAAQTGTGKTAAFTLPAMDRIDHAKGGAGPLMLVVTPTRELAQQIGEVAGQVAVSTHHRITTVVGGLSYKPQIERLKRGCDVLIATPGRLIDLMDQKAVRLADVEVLVLDEADRMLDMGFLPSVKKIVAATPSTRQTLLFSATIDSSVRKVVGSMLRDPETVEIARKGDVARTIDQYAIRVSQVAKPALIKAILAEKGADKVIVFCRTRHRADATCRKLKRAGYAAEAIHSDRSQNQRRRALDKFASGEVNIITATDVLARGIDVDQVDYVINYDVPEQPEDYIHRIGRTGRAGNEGFAVSFVTPETEAAMRDIEKLVKRTIPAMELADFDLAAAEAEAAQNAIAAKAKRDPEVNRVKRALANKERSKSEDDASAPASKEKPARNRGNRNRKKTAAKATHQHPSKQQGKQQAKQQGKTQGKRSQDAVRKSAKAKTQPSGQQKRQSQGGGDFRPGRSRRAEVQRTRARKHR